ncbi:substrate adhesion molecule [Tieghemostelium lacteum]|uniref:Substrate adhesion molecule n=1 Tax=Tieghemostelium lacteum TaxID=361077 RepID=A0A151ZKE4_TIELA|nr:substrate adhesion molecule [Tieghemostelium lacteum]|eukprot:KYQ94443.1 substrate adhesion molecule [Tieghemostelium lacteum]
MKTLLSFVLVLVLASFVVDATHFRYGTIYWEPVAQTDSNYKTIKFTAILSFRKSYWESGTVYPGAVINHSSINFGDGNSQTLTMTVSNDINNEEDYFIGRSEFTYTYWWSGNYTVYYKDCCRISTLENNADEDWYISTSVYVYKPSTQPRGVMNTSPTAGFVPIVTVEAGRVNTFKILGYDAQNDPLTYRLSNIWGSSLYHPTGLSLTGNVITFTPGPVDNGKDYELYCTQVIISDGVSYIVVDFLFKAVRPIDGVCDPSCVNNGQPCTGNSDCLSCTNSTVPNTCAPKQPPYFFGLTPDAGQVLQFPIGINKSFAIESKSPYPNKGVSITVSNTPLGSIGPTITNGANNNPTKSVYYWQPTIDNIGSYVIAASTQDADGTPATEGVRSFVLLVVKPTCGHGTQTPTGCVCDNGWSNTTNCYDCDNGYHGPECLPNNNCNGNGDSNSGVTGDGLCNCYQGWEGPYCNITVSRYCVKTDNSAVTDAVYGKGFIATSLSVVLSTYSNIDSLKIPLNLTKPTKYPVTNILAVFDTAPLSQAIWNNIKSEIGNFEDDVSDSITESTEWALGYFTDPTSSSVAYQPTLFGMGSPLADSVKNLSTTVSTTSNGGSMLALKAAASSTVAWKTGAFKVILILTDSDYQADSATEAATVQALIDNSIFPVIVSFGGNSIPKWEAFVAANLGVAISSTKAGSVWRTNAVTALKSASGLAYPKYTSASDSQFITTPTPSKTTVTNSGSYTFNYYLKYPQNVANLPVRPKVYLSIPGYGKTSIAISYNHPPVPQPAQISMKEDTSATINFVVTDIDSNIIDISFPSFSTISSLGEIRYNGVATSTGVGYSVKSGTFTFVPNANANVASPVSLSYIASDGCLTASSTLSIMVEAVNDPVSCSNIATLTTSINTPVTFNLQGIDVDSTVTVVLSSFNTLASKGSLTTGGNAALSGYAYANNALFSYIQTDNSYTGLQTLSWTVSDGLTSKTCTVSIQFSHINSPPVIASAAKVTTKPTTQATINIVVSDTDSPSGVLTVSAITFASGATSASYTNCAATPTTIGVGGTVNYAITNGQAALQLCITPPNMVATAGYSTITFQAKDTDNAQSNAVTVTIDVVGQRQNTAPVVNQIPNFTFTQGDTVSPVSITGTDADQPNFDNTLLASITTPPTNGKFVVSGGSTAAPTSNAPYSITYQPNSGFFGTDSFSYAVIDELGAQSTIKTTTITVLYKPSAPVLNIPLYSFNQFTTPSVQTLAVSDVDIVKNADVVKCNITSLPAISTLLDQNQNPITAVPFALNAQYQYYIKGPQTYQSYQENFGASCTDKFSLSASATGTIKFTYINQPPTATSSSETTDQNVPKQFTFNVNDLEGPASVKLLTVPTNGKITCNGVVAAVNVVISTVTCIYTPDLDKSNWDTTGHLGPLDAISFVAVDKDSATSDTASVLFYVIAKNPPIYTGNERVSTLEDSSLPVLITGQPGNGGSSYSVRITGIQGNGTFYKQYCMGSEGCISKPITSNQLPYESVQSTIYDYLFTPFANENGDAYMVVSFVLFEGTLVSKTYTITIDVTPVNDPPTIQLVSSQIVGTNTVLSIPSSGTVGIPVNTSFILTYTGADIDSPVDSLDSLILAVPIRGSLFRYDAQSTNYQGTLITRVNNVVAKSSGNTWKVVYVPDKGASGVGYAKISVSIRDDFDALSGSASVSVDVDPINLPPYINATQTEFNVVSGSPVQITNVTFDDPDSTYNNVSLIVSLLTTDNQPVTDAQIVLYGEYAKNCLLLKGTLACLGTKTVLNSFLQTIAFNQTSGEYIVRVYVNDLGYNAAPSKRAQSFLTATKDLKVTVTEPEQVIKKTTNKTVLSAAIAGAAVAAGIIAAGVWKLVKRAAPPTDAFFGDNPFSDGAVTSNPLYAESANSGVNPFYEASNA